MNLRTCHARELHLLQVNANATECPNPMGEIWQDWSAQVWA